LSKLAGGGKNIEEKTKKSQSFFDIFCQNRNISKLGKNRNRFGQNGTGRWGDLKKINV
jgi:hypothetical protein